MARTTIQNLQIRDHEVYERHLAQELLDKIFRDWNRFEYVTTGLETGVTVPNLDVTTAPPLVFLNGVAQYSDEIEVVGELITFVLPLADNDQIIVLHGKLPGIVPPVTWDSILNKPQMLDVDSQFESYDITSISYNANSDVEVITYHTGNKQVMSYDANGEVLNVKYYDVDGATLLKAKSFTYDGLGNISTVTWS
jgi:hypothetical protein